MNPIALIAAMAALFAGTAATAAQLPPPVQQAPDANVPEGVPEAAPDPEAEAAARMQALADALRGQRYVAMGSSFAAGPMLPPPRPGGAARCGRSLSNYPSLLAERFGMELVDRSCSGARTDHILGPWNEIPPQLDAVNADTRLVTVTIGGNDLNYIGNLFSATCAFNSAKAVAAGGKPRNCPAVRVPSEFDYARDEMQLHEIARRIRAAAPDARLVFVQYLMPLPPAGALCEATPISEANAEITRRIGQRLAVITRRVAHSWGALVIEMNQASDGHSPCDAEPWMIGAPEGYDGKQGLQWHLNKEGMQATADGIAYWLAWGGIEPGRTNVPPAQ